MNRKGLLGFALVLAGSCSAQACEPFLPFMQVVGGPAILTHSFIVLGVAVAVKSAAFAAWQRSLGFWHALVLMLAGNVLSTVVGVVAAAMLGSAMLLFFGIGVAGALALVPARRLIGAAPYPWLRHFSPGGLAGVMAFALALSCVLFGFAQMGVFADRPAVHWGVKLVAVYLALVVSIVLTAFWEEWTIWRLAPHQDGQGAFVKPVVQANLLVLFGVMLYAAAVMVPQRLRSASFLVGSSLSPSTYMEAGAGILTSTPGRAPSRRRRCLVNALFRLAPARSAADPSRIREIGLLGHGGFRIWPGAEQDDKSRAIREHPVIPADTPAAALADTIGYYSLSDFNLSNCSRSR